MATEIIPQQSVQPNTTAQQDLTTAGQRKINLIWEYTQAFIAIVTVLGNVMVGVFFAIKRIPSGEYPLVLSSSLFLIIGFYFSRSNHSAIGGIGSKPTDNQPYVGR
jgi:hypothetical protein